MKLAIEIASDGMIYIPNSVEITSGAQKLIGGDTYTETQTAR
jgi:hypothetical protein